jgi:hypothetical protein
MRELSSAEIEHYVAIDRPLDCAGSFKWEALGISLFEFVRSPDPTALEGLPLIALCDLLRQAGISLPSAAQARQDWLQLLIDRAIQLIVLARELKWYRFSM